MADSHRQSRGFREPLTHFFRSWHAPAALGAVVLVALLVWLMPRRIERVVPVDGTAAWDAQSAPPRREIVWEPAHAIPDLVADPAGTARLIAPRLTDGGATLYLARQTAAGQADILRSRFLDGSWRPAEPVEELNTPHDEIGPVVSRDGRRVFFYSSRPGGFGGYDLYVSERTEAGWREPRNLGPRINTPADEYDPAVSPDGLTLYFSSNRTDEMQVEAEAERPEESRPWTTTLRARRGRTTFDLYVSRRESIGDDWPPAEAIGGLNLPDSNEGAPFVSPDGAFLYFASDRPARDGEAANLDLYRVRLSAGVFGEPENLGPTVNSGAHETEPALSPEGFTLVFSSDRDGRDRLYLSTAQEVERASGWDTSRLSAVSPFRWWMLLATLLVAALVALLVSRYGDRFARRVWAARFFLAGVLVNLMILLLLVIWKLPDVVDVIASRFRDETPPAPQLLVDDERQPQEGDRRPAFEKVADLPSAVERPQVEAPRQQEPAPAAPSERVPAPTIPADQARLLVPERVAVVPPQPRIEPQPRPPSERPAIERAATMPRVAAAAEEIVRPEAAEIPAERPIEQNVQLGRQEAMARPAEPPARPAARLRRNADLPTVVEIQRAEPSESPPVNPPEAAERLVRAPRAEPSSSTVRALAEAVTPVDPVQVPGEQPIAAAEVMTARGSQEAAKPQAASDLPGPAPLKAEAKPTQPFRPQAESTAFRQQSGFEVDEPTPGGAPTRLARQFRRPSGIDDLAEADADKPIELAESLRPAEASPEQTELELARAAAAVSQLDDLTPAELPRPDLVAKLRPVSHPLDAPPNRAGDAEPLEPRSEPLERTPPRRSRLALREDFATLEAMFTLRRGELRKKHIQVFGGTKKSEEAVNRGLEWLAAHQNADGSWSLDRFHENCQGKHPNCTGAGSERSDTAATGFALLPFLAADQTHRKKGRYQQTVAAGLKWLVEHQKPDGNLLAPGSNQHMYSHGIAAIALCEAYGMTRDPALKEPAQKSLEFIAKAQHEPSGGWRYTPNQSGDTSVVGWQVMALKSGEMAGLQVPQQTLEGVHRWLKHVEGNQPVGGRFGYTSRGETPAMTAEGLLCLQFLHTRRSDPRMVAGADYLLKHPPQRSQQHTSYYWYYATQVMYHMQGRYWDEWNQPMRDLLEETQIKEGPLAGTWAPVDQWERRAGRLYATAMKLLMLEVYYRHLPLYGPLPE